MCIKKLVAGIFALLLTLIPSTAFVTGIDRNEPDCKHSCYGSNCCADALPLLAEIRSLTPPPSSLDNKLTIEAVETSAAHAEQTVHKAAEEHILSISAYERDSITPPSASIDKAAYVYNTGESGNERDYSCPEAFYVTDSRIYVLDTYNKIVRVYDKATGVLMFTIDLGFAAYITHIAAYNETIYVLDAAANSVIVINGSVNHQVIEMPKVTDSFYDVESDATQSYTYDAAPLADRLYIDDGRLVVSVGPYGDFILNGNTFQQIRTLYAVTESNGYYSISHKGRVWSIPSKNIGIDIHGCDSKGNLYVYCVSILINNEGKLCGTDSLRIYDSNSKLVSCADVDYYDQFTLPSQFICLGDDNRFYAMVGRADRLDILALSLYSEAEYRG